MKSRVTQMDVAREAGVSHATVSLALREHASIPQKTRERIKEIAERLGYAPDPMLAGLAAYRMSQRPAAYRSNIAWVYNFPSAVGGDFGEYYKSASKRAKELGFNLEVIHMADIDYNPKRLEQILDAKGITGLLLPPCPLFGGELRIDFSRFSAVRFGYSYRYPMLHTVVNAQFHTAYTAFQKVMEAGYQRIGFMSSKDLDQRTAWGFLGGITTGQKLLAKANRIEPYYLDDAQGYGGIGDWIRRERIDAVIGLGAWASVRDSGLDVGYADLGVSTVDRHVTGMDQNAPRIGIAAVEFLTSMMHRAETGIPDEPTYLCVQSRWVEGETLCR